MPDRAWARRLGGVLKQRQRGLSASGMAESLPAPSRAAWPAPRSGLARANAELVLDLQCRRPVRTAALEIGATIIPGDQRAAKRADRGSRGHQPVLALRAPGRT